MELFGFINLFGDFFPVVLGFLRQLPFIGPILRGPVIGPVLLKKSLLMNRHWTGWLDHGSYLYEFIMSRDFMHRRIIPTCFLNGRDVRQGPSMWRKHNRALS